jgi:hypothetical protein
VIRFVIAALALVVGCKKSAPSVEQMREQRRTELAVIVDKHRAPFVKMLAAFRAVAVDAAPLPPVTAREPVAGSLPVPELTGTDLKDTLAKAGVVVASASWFADDKPTVGEQLRLDPGITSGLAKLVETGTFNIDSESAARIDERFATVERVHHVAVTRVHEYQPPRLDAERRFQGGTAKGDVLVYALPARTRVGAFPFEVGQHDAVTIDRRKDVTTELEKGFHRDFENAIYRELAAYAAGKPGPATPGAAISAKHEQFKREIETQLRKWSWDATILPGAIAVAFEAGATPTVTIGVDEPAPVIRRQSEVEALVSRIVGRTVKVQIVAATKP